MAYPALRTTKEDDNVEFSFLRRQLFTSDQAEALEREIFLLRSVARRSTQNVFLRHESLSLIKRTKETLKNVLLLLEKTRIRNVRRTSKHFPTTKIDFLMTKVVLAITRTITVSRNATDDFRTESERLAYGYYMALYIMQFQTAISRKRLKIGLIPYQYGTIPTKSIKSGLEALRGRITEIAFYVNDLG